MSFWLKNIKILSDSHYAHRLGQGSQVLFCKSSLSKYFEGQAFKIIIDITLRTNSVVHIITGSTFTYISISCVNFVMQFTFRALKRSTNITCFTICDTRGTTIGSDINIIGIHTSRAC